MALAPWPGEVFVALPLEALRERKITKPEHIHECAMLCLDCAEDEAQHIILDYMLANPTVPLFMLDKVPMYVAGWKAAMKLLGHNA